MGSSRAIGRAGLVFFSSVTLSLIGCGSNNHPPDGATMLADATASAADMASATPPGDMAVANTGGDMAVATGVQTVTVHVAPGGALLFSPAAMTISTGDTVHWIFDSPAHNVTSGQVPTPDGRFCSLPGPNGDCTTGRGTVFSNVGDSFDHTFAEGGTFPYFCGVHLFSGTITVKARM
jgi:plastocyanin